MCCLFRSIWSPPLVWRSAATRMASKAQKRKRKKSNYLWPFAAQYRVLLHHLTFVRSFLYRGNEATSIFQFHFYRLLTLCWRWNSILCAARTTAKLSEVEGERARRSEIANSHLPIMAFVRFSHWKFIWCSTLAFVVQHTTHLVIHILLLLLLLLWCIACSSCLAFALAAKSTIEPKIDSSGDGCKS